MLVLGVVAITVAMSYVLIRSQTASIAVQSNSESQSSARSAAMAGIHVALRRMHEKKWGGPGSSVEGWISDTQRYHVTYTAGDLALKTTHPKYADLPYRVTLVSTGHSSSKSTGATAMHRIRVVVRLVPRATWTLPSLLQEATQFTFFQTAVKTTSLELPFQIAGPSRFQGRLDLALAYPTTATSRQRYLDDLGLMVANNQPDYRLLSGAVSLPFGAQATGTLALLTSSLKLAVLDVPASTTTWNVTYPLGKWTYQLYTGGPIYEGVEVPVTLDNVDLRPDPQKNPLGVFYTGANTLALGQNVSIHGSLVARRVTISGANLNLRPVELAAPSPSGTVRLPTLLCERLSVSTGVSGSIRGMVYSSQLIEYLKGSETTQLDIQGHVITPEFKVREREPWDSINWTAAHARYLTQVAIGDIHFPVYMAKEGRNGKPLLTMRPDSAPVRYVWKETSNHPIYVPGATDDHYRWEVVRWVDNVPVR
jgi:hypothetical protein